MPPHECPHGDELLAYRRGTLPDTERERVAAHLASCGACAAALGAAGPRTEPFGATPAGRTRTQLLTPGGAVPDGPTADAPAAGVGTVLAGRYKLLEVIGEGGMGVVYTAQQTEPVRRTVAVKVIKEGMDTRQVLARFEAERQALALMDHPNIAKVLDAGASAAGRPFFVMELVKGLPVTRYCDDHRLTTRERLGLFVTVCRAIQHAHQKGVIHRDIKPGNVLVARYDGRPVVKVIDFGVAKATGPALTDRTLVTCFGAVLGTPQYMSPEQAEANQLDVDTRSDVYALGVLLYELLTGTTPLERGRLLRSAALEVLRMVREEEPPRPSSRLSSSEGLPGLAERRGTEPHRLAALVRGDLDWITMRALEKDRDRRYETANGLARDVERFLADEPVEACPPTAAYRLRKALRRYKGPLRAAAAFAATLVAATAVSGWQAVRATRAEGRERAARLEAVRNGAVARATNDFLLRDIIGQANPEFRDEHDPDVTLGAVLDRASRGASGRFGGEPRVEAAVLLAIGGAYRALGRFGDAEPLLQRAHGLSRRARGDRDPETLDAVFELGRLEEGRYAYRRARDLYEEVLRGREAAFGGDDPRTVDALEAVAGMCQFTGEAGRAVPLHERVVRARRLRLGPGHEKTIDALNSLASAYRVLGRQEESRDRRVEALELARRHLKPGHLTTLQLMNGLVLNDAALKRFAEAEAVSDELLDVSERALGPTHPTTLVALNTRGSLLTARGEYARAERVYNRLLALRAGQFGPGDPRTLVVRSRLASLHELRGDLEAAERALTELLEGRLALPDRAAPEVAQTMTRLGSVALRRGRFAEAEARYLGAVAELDGKPGPADRKPLAEALAGLGEGRLRQKKYSGAEPPLRRCLGQAPEPSSGWWGHEAESLLGECLLGAGRPAEAEPLLLAGYAGMKVSAGDRPAWRRGRAAETAGQLARLYGLLMRTGDEARWREKS